MRRRMYIPKSKPDKNSSAHVPSTAMALDFIDWFAKVPSRSLVDIIEWSIASGKEKSNPPTENPYISCLSIFGFCLCAYRVNTQSRCIFKLTCMRTSPKTNWPLTERSDQHNPPGSHQYHWNRSKNINIKKLSQTTRKCWNKNTTRKRMKRKETKREMNSR